MKKLIDLLERKNLCFRNFHKICLEFLDEISQGKVDHLEQFQQRRASLIKVQEQLETEIAAFLKNHESDPDAFDALITPKEKAEVGALLNEKDDTVRAILDLDLQILSHIDRLKDQTIQRLQAVQSGKRGIGAYRSPLDHIENAENSTTREA